MNPPPPAPTPQLPDASPPRLGMAGSDLPEVGPGGQEKGQTRFEQGKAIRPCPKHDNLCPDEKCICYDPDNRAPLPIAYDPQATPEDAFACIGGALLCPSNCYPQATPFCDEHLKEGWSGDALCLGEDDARTLERAKLAAVAERDEAYHRGRSHELIEGEWVEIKEQRDSLSAQLKAAEAKSDAEMERVKACEHIAEGEEGWEALSNLCPSTAAVAQLRTERDEAKVALATALAALSELREASDDLISDKSKSSVNLKLERHSNALKVATAITTPSYHVLYCQTCGYGRDFGNDSLSSRLAACPTCNAFRTFGPEKPQP